MVQGWEQSAAIKKNMSRNEQKSQEYTMKPEEQPTMTEEKQVQGTESDQQPEQNSNPTEEKAAETTKEETAETATETPEVKDESPAEVVAEQSTEEPKSTETTDTVEEEKAEQPTPVEATTDEESEAAADEESTEKEGDEEESFEDLLAKYDSFREYRPGEIVSGTVVSITEKDVLVDIGARVEAVFSASELNATENNEEVQLKDGDKINVMIVRFSPVSNSIPVSFERARVSQVWDEIEAHVNEERTIKGKVIEKVKGGFIVDIGVRAFLPTSLATMKPQKDYSGLIGEVYDFNIVKLQRRRGNVILSRKELLQKEYDESRKALLEVLKEGAVVKGKVKSLTDYGAFIDLGGMDGLLHVTDMSWGRVAHPKDVLNVGDEIEAKVLRLDMEKEKISLSIKHMLPDPWLSAFEKYSPGTKISGKVLNIATYGAFVELEAGVEGLIHVSEMSWTKVIRNASQMLKKGDLVEAIVLDVDPENRKISLSLRQTKENPWETLGQRFPGGSRVKGKVRNITEFGAFVEIEEGIDGLVHVSDFAWGVKNANPSDYVKKGEEVEVYILSVDSENQKVSLSIKKLTPDPWVEFLNDFKEGQIVKAPVVRVTDFGVFLKLTDFVDGLIHQGDLNIERNAKPADVFKEGDDVQAMISRISRKDKKVYLSIRRMIVEEERRAIREYTNNQDGGGAKMGDFMKDLM
ncbi:MAG: 30S ribosomal protein S1 [Acidobacteria bacterium]|nr:MAG: 30S ribosomal protein S1 [Acidobacteriota bacterium]